MDFEGATYLYTLATLMITFAGFSALLFVIRQATGAKLSLLDRFIVRNILMYVFVLSAAALLPMLLDSFYIGTRVVWQVSGLLFAIPMLSLQVTYPLRRRRVVGSTPPLAIYAVFVVLGSLVTLAMLVWLVLDPERGAAIYTTALTIDFFTVVFGFVNALDIIMQQDQVR
jgi:hypothetical protein